MKCALVLAAVATSAVCFSACSSSNSSINSSSSSSSSSVCSSSNLSNSCSICSSSNSAAAAAAAAVFAAVATSAAAAVAMAMAHEDVVFPFLNIFQDGRLLDSFCLDGRNSFVLGRHTNCDVLLAHPSISRHHLEIQLLRATRELRLTDLDSANGTWIEGKQVPPLRPKILKEGEPIKLGASSLVYKVQWLPHPQPTSSNDGSNEMSALHSPESDHSSIANAKRRPCSTKTNNDYTGSHEIQEQHDSHMLDQYGISSPRAVQSPRIVQEMLVAGQTHSLSSPISASDGNPMHGRDNRFPFDPGGSAEIHACMDDLYAGDAYHAGYPFDPGG